MMERILAEQHLAIICAGCGAGREVKPTRAGHPRTPTGWKQRAGETYCSICWRERYILRAITIPVASPISCEWAELRESLAIMWRDTTALSNWALTELWARDVRRTPGAAKMPPMAAQYLYPAARQQFPSIPSQSVASILQAVDRKYRARRYDTNWTCAATLPTMRYPQPFPAHNQSWSLSFVDDRPVFSARIGEQRIEMRLKGGPRYHRQTAALKQIAAGIAVQGEAAFLRAHDGEIRIKLVAWLPRKNEKANGDRTLFVRTAADSLIVAVDAEDNRIWIENADQLRRWIAEYERVMQRLREDRKAEQRPVPSFTHRQDALGEKQSNRMTSAIQEIGAHVAGFARRRKFVLVRYDDSEHGFAGDGFPYFALRERIKMKLDESGIAMEHVASGDVAKKNQEPLAEGKTE